MSKLKLAEVEARFTPELGEFIRTTYAAELEKVVCRACGAHQKPGPGGPCEGRGELEPGCGERDDLSKLDENEAHQATRTETHAWLRAKFPELSSEGAWSIVDGSTADHGHRTDAGAVWRCGLRWNDVLHESKLREHRDRLANLEAGARIAEAVGIVPTIPDTAAASAEKPPEPEPGKDGAQ